MNAKPWIMPALIGVLLLVTAGLWWRAAIQPGATPGRGRPSAAEVRALQSQADAACRCARRRSDGPGNGPCWAEFNRNLARFEHSSTGTMCREESVSMECFGAWGGEPCVFTQRSYGGCSDTESRRREAQARARHESGCSD